MFNIELLNSPLLGLIDEGVETTKAAIFNGRKFQSKLRFPIQQLYLQREAFNVTCSGVLLIIKQQDLSFFFSKEASVYHQR